MVSLYWVHTDRPNPDEDGFWGKIPTSVAVHRVCGGSLEAAWDCIEQAQAPLHPDETRVCLIHISDLFDRDAALAAFASMPKHVACMFFTKGGERQLVSQPYICGLETNVLLNLHGVRELASRDASAREFRNLFNLWADSERSDLHLLRELLPLDILVQGALMVLERHGSGASLNPVQQRALDELDHCPWMWYSRGVVQLSGGILDDQGTSTPRLDHLLPADNDGLPGLRSLLRIAYRAHTVIGRSLTRDECDVLSNPKVLLNCHRQYLTATGKAVE